MAVWAGSHDSVHHSLNMELDRALLVLQSILEGIVVE